MSIAAGEHKMSMRRDFDADFRRSLIRLGSPAARRLFKSATVFAVVRFARPQPRKSP
jgi:hypothetical protein